MISRIIPVFMIIGAVALFLGYVQPTHSGAIAERTSEIRDLDIALEAAREFKEKEVELARERSLIDLEQLARLESFLPDSVDNVQLIVDLNSLAARSGVQLSDFSIDGDQGATAEGASAPNQGAPSLALESAEPIESLDLSVAATGTYAAFRTFLDGVEASLRPLDIVELSVQDSPTGVYAYEVTFRLYWLR